MRSKDQAHPNLDFRRWVKLVRVTDQIGRAWSDEKPLERGFWTFQGFLLGLVVAWLLQ